MNAGNPDEIGSKLVGNAGSQPGVVRAAGHACEAAPKNDRPLPGWLQLREAAARVIKAGFPRSAKPAQASKATTAAAALYSTGLSTAGIAFWVGGPGFAALDGDGSRGRVESEADDCGSAVAPWPFFQWPGSLGKRERPPMRRSRISGENGFAGDSPRARDSRASPWSLAQRMTVVTSRSR